MDPSLSDRNSMHKNFLIYELEHRSDENNFDLELKICHIENEIFECNKTLYINKKPQIVHGDDLNKIANFTHELGTIEKINQPFKIMLEVSAIEEISFTLKALIFGDTCIDNKSFGKGSIETKCANAGNCISNLPEDNEPKCDCPTGWKGKICDEHDSCKIEVSFHHIF
jgi:hypothetical protein